MTELAPSRPRVFSGMQPTSDSLHLGNYLGALLPWVRLQDDYDAIYSVVDLHSITAGHDPELLERRTRLVAAQYLAAGIDPERSIVFCQSHVPAHALGGWIMSCLTGFGEASRMTQFKDKAAKGGEGSASVGLFTYPTLMAADVLLYRAHAVPVGEDQKQHLELMRDLATRFNARFGEDTLVVPEPLIPQAGARIMDLQNPTSKMSKSTQTPAGLLNVLDDPKVVAKRIKSAVTDAGTQVRFDPENSPGIANLLNIHSALSGKPIDDIVASFEGRMYGHLKVEVAELVVELFRPIREGIQGYLDDPAELDRILARGAQRAAEIADPVLTDMMGKLGFVPAAARA